MQCFLARHRWDEVEKGQEKVKLQIRNQTKFQSGRPRGSFINTRFYVAAYWRVVNIILLENIGIYFWTLSHVCFCDTSPWKGDIYENSFVIFHKKAKNKV